MNASPPYGQFRSGAIVRDANDEKMDQIRELLIGEYVRAHEARMVAIETRIREVELALTQRLDAMAARIEALAGETDADRRTSFDELAKSVIGLGEQIRRISKP